MFTLQEVFGAIFFVSLGIAFLVEKIIDKIGGK